MRDAQQLELRPAEYKDAQRLERERTLKSLLAHLESSQNAPWYRWIEECWRPYRLGQTDVLHEKPQEELADRGTPFVAPGQLDSFERAARERWMAFAAWSGFSTCASCKRQRYVVRQERARDRLCLECWDQR